MDSRSEIATQKFLEGFNCAQSVLFVLCDQVGLDRQTALRIACGFGAGMGRRQEVCGAVSGGIMVCKGCVASVVEIIEDVLHE